MYIIIYLYIHLQILIFWKIRMRVVFLSHMHIWRELDMQILQELLSLILVK